MIKIIDKKKFVISEVESWKVSEYLNTHYVYTGILPDPESDEIPKGFVFAEGTMNIAGVNGKNYDIAECTGIEYMTPAERQAYYDGIAESQRIASFRGKKVKMTIDQNFANANLNGFVVACSADSNIINYTETIEVKDNEGYVTDVQQIATLLMNFVKYYDYVGYGNEPAINELIPIGSVTSAMLTSTDKATVQNLIKHNIIAVDTIGSEAIDFIENGKRKYIIPQ